MRKYSIIVVFLLTAVFKGYGQDTSEFFDKTDVFLKTYVKDGRVDYKTIKNDTSELDELLEIADKTAVSKDRENEFQAFWINGYNVLVIRGIVDNYPLKSPLDVAGFFDKKKHDIGGISITLNDIENKLLRGNFPSEPRFHFVLVCAGLGCPPIVNSVYRPSTLGTQLEERAKIALNDPDFIQVNKNKIKISQIFEWYKDDFTQGSKNLVDYINQYRIEKLLEKAKVSYYPYDWTLNEIK